MTLRNPEAETISIPTEFSQTLKHDMAFKFHRRIFAALHIYCFVYFYTLWREGKGWGRVRFQGPPFQNCWIRYCGKISAIELKVQHFQTVISYL